MKIYPSVQKTNHWTRIISAVIRKQTIHAWSQNLLNGSVGKSKVKKMYFPYEIRQFRIWLLMFKLVLMYENHGGLEYFSIFE